MNAKICIRNYPPLIASVLGKLYELYMTIFRYSGTYLDDAKIVLNCLIEEEKDREETCE